MFGHKIRAWMENITRNKKTKSKSKHNSNSCAIMGKEGSNGGFGSPTLIRRSEISPLQSMNGGRAGWKTPDSPGKRTTVDFANCGDDRHRYNYRSEEVKKVIISRPQSQSHKRDTIIVESSSKHSSSVISEFGSVMNYVSSPESAYSTGYSTSSYDLGYQGVGDAVKAPAINCPSKNTISYDSPSPRQRSRIRTNPWYKTQLANGNSLMPSIIGCGSYIPPPSCSSIASSPSYHGRPRSNCSSPSKPFFSGCDNIQSLKNKNNQNNQQQQLIISPNSLRKRKLIETIDCPSVSFKLDNGCGGGFNDSVDSLNDDDSTLKEIMGKFEDISYTYDKETDILSDSSDHTQCQEDHSDFDTGQEAEDEYEEEIDFIDKHAVSITESVNKHKNYGSCEYYEEKRVPVLLPPPIQHQQAVQLPPQVNRASLKLRKRLRRTRKRSECNTPGRDTAGSGSDQPRECRSLGGTPILNRRAAKLQASQMNNSDRCNSLSTLNSPQKTLITIAESEKALLKSDLEAFMKYRELISEAETILGSFKAPTIVDSCPLARNVVPHLPNKRVEMLRAGEINKRSSDILGTNNGQNNSVKVPISHKFKPHSPLPVNKTIELLKQEQFAFAPPPPPPQSQQAKMNAKENYPPRQNSPQLNRIQATVICPNSEPLKRKLYVPSKDSIHYHQELFLRNGGGDSNKNLRQEMLLRTLEDLKRSLVDQKTELYTLNEKA